MNAPASLAVAFYPHHVEHLAPLCALLDMPMLCCDSPGQAAAVACYPGLDVVWMRGITHETPVQDAGAQVRDLAPGTIYYSHLFGRPALRALLTRPGLPAPRVVHVPHGFSEKRQPWSREVATQDIALLPGRFALDQLAELGVMPMLHYFALGGDLRRHHYAAHRMFFDTQAASLGAGADASRRTVLYAPTWQDKVGASSFLSAFAPLAQQLPAGWRLVAKLHPHLEQDAAAIARVAELCRGRDDIVLLRNLPLVYPLLQQADIYVGDMSSLAYDFLHYNRPMIFLNEAQGTPTDPVASRLFQCGTVLAPAQYAEVYRAIDRVAGSDSERYGEARATLDRYTYAESPPPAVLRATLQGLASGPPPTWMDPQWARNASER